MILAAGKGTRIGTAIPKQFLRVMGKPILAYTLDNFQNNSNINAIEIVCHKEWMEETKQIVHNYHFNKVKWITEGGSNFQHSVLRGITYLKDKIVYDDNIIISFGVSPMTTNDIIDDCIRVCSMHGNAIASEDMVLCTCIKENEESSSQGIPREMIKSFSNPWAFNFGELCKVYEKAINTGILESIDPHTTSLYLALGMKLWFSKTVSSNIKITTKEDLDIFEGLLLLQQKRNENEKRRIKWFLAKNLK